MMTTITLQVAASSMLLLNTTPAYSSVENISTRPEFYFGDLVYTVSPEGAELLSSENNAIDAESFLDNLIEKHDLEKLMPESRAWVANEFYSEYETLASLRLKAGLTQNQLATKLGMPQSSIARLESGRENPSIDRAKSLADALNVSLDKFYTAFELTRADQKS